MRAVLAILILAGVCANALYSQTDLDLAAINKLIAETESEIATTRRQILSVRQEIQAGIDAAAQSQEASASQIIDLLDEEEGLRTELGTLRSGADEVEGRIKRLASAQRVHQEEAARLAEQLAFLQAELPFDVDDVDWSQRAVALRKGEDAQAIIDVMFGVKKYLDSALVTKISTRTIRDEKGQMRRVELAEFGRMSYAYRDGDGHYALALASPRDSKGWRWSTDLPEDVKSALTHLFEKTSDAFPVDVSRSIRVDELEETRGLLQFVERGGWLMFPLIAVAILALLFIVERVFSLFVARRLAPGLAARVAQQGFAVGSAEDLAPKSPSHRVIEAGLKRRAVGPRAMEDAMEEAFLGELPPIQRFLSGLGVLAAVAPLIGLLGTVTGIIKTFASLRSFGGADPALLSGGISEALLTTAGGLVVAIPILLTQGFLGARADRLLAEAEREAASLVDLVTEGTTK